MNECKCDQCSKDITGDNTYCQRCYDALVDEIRTAEDRISELERQISQKELENGKT